MGTECFGAVSYRRLLGGYSRSRAIAALHLTSGNAIKPSKSRSRHEGKR
jgi:hypothetical protein